MASENCVKISFKGLTRQIVCANKFQYDELLKTVMVKFNIAKSHKLAIEFYDEQGNKYNKDTFEYLLLLFPNPQKIFFIRLDASKIIRLDSTVEEGRSILDDDRVPFGKSKLNNRQTNKKESNTYCEAAPVRRQNCFLGEIPDPTISLQPSTSSSRSHAQNMALEIVKRMRLLKQSSPKKKHLNNPTVFKRSMRI